MATPTYTLIDSTVLGSSAASITFSSIPADYRDIIAVVDSKHTTAATSGSVRIKVNDDASNYTSVNAYGYGGGNIVTSDTGTTIGANFTSDEPGLGIVHCFDYAQTDKHKSFLSRFGSTDAISTLTLMQASRWASTAAITQLEFYYSGHTFAAGSSIYLYGIEA